jgi:hypothetical protein
MATLIDFLTASATDEVVRSAMSKNFGGITEMTPEERFAGTIMSRAGVELMQNSHYQYVQGYLGEEHSRLNSDQRICLLDWRSPYTKQTSNIVCAQRELRQVIDAT